MPARRRCGERELLFGKQSCAESGGLISKHSNECEQPPTTHQPRTAATSNHVGASAEASIIITYVCERTHRAAIPLRGRVREADAGISAYPIWIRHRRGSNIDHTPSHYKRVQIRNSHLHANAVRDAEICFAPCVWFVPLHWLHCTPVIALVNICVFG
jgi:hypothetical protein